MANGTGPIASYAYTLDAAGHRTSVRELGGRTVNYSYDNLYRLTNEAISGDPHGIDGAVSYTYDPVGNRTQLTSTLAPVPAGLWSYNANDQITSDTYDANGNTTASGGLGYVYDFENHLVQQGGLTIVYDGDGNRVSKTVAGVTTTDLVSGVNPTGYPQVVSERITGNTTQPYDYQRAYVYGLERLSQQRSYLANNQNQTQTTYHVYDGHGSVRALTDTSGNVTDTYDYDAFGNLIHSTGTTPNNYLFVGEQFDPDLHLYYNRARYLNVSTGRFWTMDSFDGDPQSPLSLHKYLYAGADPVNLADPAGRDFDLSSLAAAGAAFTTLAGTAIVSFQNTLGAVYVNLYKAPEVIEDVGNILTGAAGAFEALKFLGANILNYAESYSRVPVIRGNEFEVAAGANLSPTFPAFDYWDPETGTAIQIRSTTQTSSPEALLAVVQKAVNGVNNLPPELRGYDRGGNPIVIDTETEISERGVLIGIPAKALPWFGTVLQKVREISQSQKVAVTIQFVEGLEGETLEK